MIRIAPMSRADLGAARAVLADACAFDDAATVAEEKLFEPAPGAPVSAWGAWIDEALVGVVAVSAAWVRILAVAPPARRRGVGAALLVHAEAALRAAGISRARAVGQPGNYLAPGIDERDAETIAWLTRRGWSVGAHRTVNLLIAVRDHPRVSPERSAAAAQRAAGYHIARARPDEIDELAAAVASEFGGTWDAELTRAMALDPPGVHVARLEGACPEIAAFAVHDGNNQGLGWFGPAGTWPAHRGRGLGEALLLACLVDVAAFRDVCEVAWIGPRAFYERAVGVTGERRFVSMTKEL